MPNDVKHPVEEKKCNRTSTVFEEFSERLKSKNFKKF